VGERAELIPFASWAKAVLCFLEKEIKDLASKRDIYESK
jgi:hypothetical protein